MLRNLALPGLFAAKLVKPFCKKFPFKICSVVQHGAVPCSSVHHPLSRPALGRRPSPKGCAKLRPSKKRKDCLCWKKPLQKNHAGHVLRGVSGPSILILILILPAAPLNFVLIRVYSWLNSRHYKTALFLPRFCLIARPGTPGPPAG